MKNKYTRRDSLKLMGSAVVGSQLGGRAQPLVAQPSGEQPSGAQPLDAPIDGVGADLRGRAGRADEDLRGIFVIMSTPYTE